MLKSKIAGRLPAKRFAPRSSRRQRHKPMIRAKESKSAPVGVVSKILKILEALSTSPSGLQLKEISGQTSINKSTAYRFLAHLETEGYLFRDDLGAYLVGPKLVRLGSGATYQAALRKISRPVLQQLWKVTNETVNLGILDGHDVYYVDVVQSPHPFRMASPVGSWRPVYCTAMGKALAAYLPAGEKEHVLSSIRFERFTPHTLTRLPQLRKELEKVRQRGYALDDEEAILGARCVSAPILHDESKVMAAISVAGPTTRIARDKIRVLAGEVVAAARAISTRLGASES
jgi:DNA-binding IclR family transcriptional regulator